MTLREATERSTLTSKADDTARPFTGLVFGLTTAPTYGAPLQSHQAITVLTDIGIQGDRHAGKLRQVTVVCTGELADAAAEHGVESIDGMTTRRNIVVDVPSLPRQHGARFHIGDVEFAVWRDCAPCSLMNEFFGDGAREAMQERAGICASVISGGVIQLGDAITV